MKLSTISAIVALSLFTSGSQAEEAAFTMDGELGFIFTSGNTETTSVNAALNAKQELEMWSNEFTFKALYKKDTVDGVETTSADKKFASAQGNYKLENPDHRLFGFASYEDDRFSEFDFQSTLAVGWNQKLWKDDTSSFEFSVGPGYSFADRFVTDADGIPTTESENGVVVRGAFAYAYSLSETAKFTQTFSTEVGSNNTKSRAESAVSAKIAGGLSMKVAIKFDHNSDVTGVRDNLDTETSVNLVYTFF
ncbi:MAG: putative salt-induced outer membrane protein [Glaciecola sp.]|jgi:putative salt-induced outer membrane protein